MTRCKAIVWIAREVRRCKFKAKDGGFCSRHARERA